MRRAMCAIVSRDADFIFLIRWHRGSSLYYMSLSLRKV